ncbi:uncharacterized protein LOC122073042 [Macadamia integrifolia]|uniref:uncharacterized protein LOC122073042 n=1 Tax=Macadamia integrifolia TaxID=60698 RepID=UPI001C4F04CB|nr:uncharacterized protein LOC122073042 [Macadamia integrifolia]
MSSPKVSKRSRSGVLISDSPSKKSTEETTLPLHPQLAPLWSLMFLKTKVRLLINLRFLFFLKLHPLQSQETSLPDFSGMLSCLNLLRSSQTQAPKTAPDAPSQTTSIIDRVRILCKASANMSTREFWRSRQTTDLGQIANDILADPTLSARQRVCGDLKKLSSMLGGPVPEVTDIFYSTQRFLNAHKAASEKVDTAQPKLERLMEAAKTSHAKIKRLEEETKVCDKKRRRRNN